MNYGGLFILLISCQSMKDDPEEIQAILDRRFNKIKKCFEYLVQYVNYRPSQAIWQSRDSIEHAKEMLDNFDKKHQSLEKDKKGKPIAFKQTESSESANEPIAKRGRGRPPKINKLVRPTTKQPSVQKQSPQVQVEKEKIVFEQPVVKRKRGRPKKVQTAIREEEPQSPSQRQFVEQAQQDLGEGLSSRQIEERLSYQTQSDFAVLEINKNGGEFKFYVEDGLEKKWMKREQLLREHPVALVGFYERHLEVTVSDVGHPKRRKK